MPPIRPPQGGQYRFVEYTGSEWSPIWGTIDRGPFNSNRSPALWHFPGSPSIQRDTFGPRATAAPVAMGLGWVPAPATLRGSARSCPVVCQVGVTRGTWSDPDLPCSTTRRGGDHGGLYCTSSLGPMAATCRLPGTWGEATDRDEVAKVPVAGHLRGMGEPWHPELGILGFGPALVLHLVKLSGLGMNTR